MAEHTGPGSESTDEVRRVLAELQTLTTEETNPRSTDIDLLDSAGILRIINHEDRTVAEIVGREIGVIARAVDLAAERLRRGGRLVYMGAGTSGRLGVLDAAECPPTFGTDPGQVIALLAGGPQAILQAREGVEDREDDAVADLRAVDLRSQDILVALTASRRTPYPLAGLRYARQVGAATVFVTCNTPPTDDVADVVIAAVVGPEVLGGSTRMKSGTAQKLILNMISTATMIRLGKTYQNVMIDLRPLSKKLEARRKGVLMRLLDVDYEAATALLERAQGSMKRALFMGLARCDAAEADRRLDAAGGVLRRALEDGARGSGG